LGNLGFHTLAVSHDNNVRLMVDCYNSLNFGYGAVFSFLNRRMNAAGKMVYQLYILSNNFLEFLSRFQYATYSAEKELLDHIDTLYRPGCDVTTHGIRVRATAMFCPWETPEQRFFVYQLRISDGGVQGKYKLTTRYWKITEEGQPPNEVKGPGVIGYYPEVYKGCEDFTYESCTPIHNYVGKMEGIFYFQSMDDPTENEIEVTVGPFPLELPKNSAVVNFTPQDKIIQVLYQNM